MRGNKLSTRKFIRGSVMHKATPTPRCWSTHKRVSLLGNQVSPGTLLHLPQRLCQVTTVTLILLSTKELLHKRWGIGTSDGVASELPVRLFPWCSRWAFWHWSSKLPVLKEVGAPEKHALCVTRRCLVRCLMLRLSELSVYWVFSAESTLH